MVTTKDFSELDYQRDNAKGYQGGRLSDAETEQRLQQLVDYGATRDDVDALTRRRAAEVMGLRQDELEAIRSVLRRRYPHRFRPPLWLLRPS